MDRRKFLQLTGAVTASQFLTAIPAAKRAGAQGPASAPDTLGDRILNTRPESLVAYWPLNETSGSVIKDLSPNGFDGTQSNCVLGQPGPGDGDGSIGFNGTSSQISVFSSGLASAIDTEEGTLIYRAKVYQAAIWENKLGRRAIWVGRDDHNHFSERKEWWEEMVVGARETTGMESRFEWPCVNTTSWFVVAHSWSVSQQCETVYLSPDQQTYWKQVRWGGFLPMQRPIQYAWIGRGNTRPENWAGWLSRVAWWSAPLTEAEVANLIPIN